MIFWSLISNSVYSVVDPLLNCSVGTLPLQLDLANLELSSGNHKLRITATDVTGLNETAVIAFSGKQFHVST